MAVDKYCHIFWIIIFCSDGFLKVRKRKILIIYGVLFEWFRVILRIYFVEIMAR